MTFKVGKCVTTGTSGLNSVIPISATSVCGGLLEAFTYVSVRKVEEKGEGSMA